MATEKSNANMGFEKEIWDAACVLWGHIPAADYRKVIVGLIFLRYVSCAFEKGTKHLSRRATGLKTIRMLTLPRMYFLFQRPHDGV